MALWGKTHRNIIVTSSETDNLYKFLECISGVEVESQLTDLSCWSMIMTLLDTEDVHYRHCFYHGFVAWWCRYFHAAAIVLCFCSYFLTGSLDMTSRQWIIDSANPDLIISLWLTLIIFSDLMLLVWQQERHPGFRSAFSQTGLPCILVYKIKKFGQILGVHL